MKASQLGCIGHAQAGALAVEAAFPSVSFTSGIRKYTDQARAMAQNIIHNRHWIADTYKDTPQSRQLQVWVSTHKTANQGEIEAGLAAIMATWTPEQLMALSRHMGGKAWDMEPMLANGKPTKLGQQVISFIHSLPGYQLMLLKEGGLDRWHVQFN